MSMLAIEHTVSDVIAVLHHGGNSFPYKRHEYVEASEHPLITYSLDIDVRAEVLLVRGGIECDRDFGVDPYVPEGADYLSPAAARYFAHAILAAADLAEQLNDRLSHEPAA